MPPAETEAPSPSEEGRVPPMWLTAVRSFYKAAFEHRTRPKLDASIDDWSHLSPAEQSFVQSHLLYLNLLAMGDLVAIGEEVRDQLLEVAGTLERLDHSLAVPEEERAGWEEEPLEEEEFSEEGFQEEAEDREEEADPEEPDAMEEPESWEEPAPPEGPAAPPAPPQVIDVPYTVRGTQADPP